MERFDERRRRSYDTSTRHLNPIEHARPVVVAERQAWTSNERSLDAFHDDSARRVQNDAAPDERLDEVHEPLSIFGRQCDGCDEIWTLARFEAGAVRRLRRRTLPQNRVEQYLNSDVCDRAGGPATEPALAKRDVSVVAERMKLGKIVEHVIGQVMKAHAVFECGVRHRGCPNTEHRDEIREHRAEHEFGRLGEAPGDGRVAEEVHYREA
jgi:hypothetical protein